ncbi:MAG TPA: isoprenylcysteine carboxylmethyltransferase family protein [Tepidisphaeraceae bacterium]|nr:isoprenylcysteine carboxylmethyltransferase family protein [Tepidisphaeraceae bacterium]
MTYRIVVFVLGLIVAAYWMRVVRMARKARQKTGRAANFLPPEPIGRLLRVLWIPVVTIWIVHPFVTSIAFPRTTILRPLAASMWLAIPAVLAAGLCFWATRVCWRTMGKNWRMGIDPSEQNSLVLAGPYAFVRHPIYALSQAMFFASAVALPSPLMIIACLLHISLLQWEARREEAHLSRVHGDEYRDYCSRVRRFIPVPHRA